MLNVKVAKFGGSSVANAEQIKKVANIIQEDDARKFIVVSAPGKRESSDIKVTDLLLALGESFVQKNSYEHEVKVVLDRFQEIIQGLDLSKSILQEIEDEIYSVIKAELSNEMKIESLKAIGEDSCAKILNEYLNSHGVQSLYMNPKDAGIIVSNEPGNANVLEESYDKIYTLRNYEGRLIIPGFFGYTKDGQLMTFSRGGSDITGSIIAAGVEADLYENFTDVDSVYTVNPNIVKNPKKIRKLTYREMRELSYAGFSVFHDEALIPAFQKGIPVCIKNTNNPKAEGTMIVSEREPDQRCVVGIASDTGFCSLYVSKYLMNRELGFGRKLLQILEEQNISFEHAPSGIDDMSVILRESQLTEEKKEKIFERIQNELKPDTVKIHRDLALIMVVGEGMESTVGIAYRAAKAISDAGVNIEMINQGSSEVSLMFGVKTDGLERAIQSLYLTFFETDEQ